MIMRLPGTISVCLSIGLLLLSTTFVASAEAQSASTATLAGVVRDAQDAVVPGALVRVSDEAKGLAREATTTPQGEFVIVELPPGLYDVTVAHPGFSTARFDDVTVNVSERRLLRVALSVAAIGQEVTVSAAVPLVRETPAVSTVVTRQIVQNQPLNGRSFQTLVALAPGTVLTGADLTRPGQFSVNGQRTNTNYFTIDGVSANFGSSASVTPYENGGGVPAYSAFGSTNSLASVDSVQEFTLQTSTYSPEFGRQPGAQVSIVTRSGSNRFTGSAFEYFRDAKMDANNFFANANGLKKPAVRMNDFGGVIGGPVQLGPLYDGMDRTFFFASYEGLRVRQPFVTSPLQVPSLEARAAASGTASGAASGAVRDIVNAFPLPTGATLANDPTAAPYIGSFSNPSTLDATSVRIDQTINSRLRVFGRYNEAPSENRNRALFCAASCISVTESHTRTLTMGAPLIVSSSMVNDLKVNVSRSRTKLAYEIDDFGGAIVPAASSLYPSFTTRDQGYIYIQVDGAGDNTISDGLFVDNRQTQFQIINTLSWVAGSHTVKFGVDYRRLAPESNSGSYRRQWNPNSIAALTQNISANATIVAPDYVLRPRYSNLSAFAQDTWRASSQLTLTYGLRYDLNPAPTEADDHLPLTVTGFETPAAMTLAAAGSRFYETDYAGIAPRVGVTYSPRANGGLIIKGGVGLFYDLGTSFLGNAFSTSLYPVARTVNYGAVAFDAPQLAIQPAPVSANPPYPRVFAFQDSYRLPYTIQYNAGIEQAIGTFGSVSATYVGAQGRRLGRVSSLRNPNPAFTRVDVVTNDAESSYDSLQLQYQQRAARGVHVLVSYTLGRSEDTVSDESINNFQSPPNGRVSPDLDRGPSNFDVRHSLSTAVSYEVPAPRGGSSVMRALLSGFGVDAIIRARSALPVNVLTGRDPFGFAVTTIGRPDLVSGVPLYLQDDAFAGGKRFNPAAFDAAAPQAAGRQGTLERNALRGFGASQVDLSVRRRIAIAGRANLLLRVDAFNVLNHANFANPSGILTAATFGRATQMLGSSMGGLSPLFQIGGPRSLQVSARIEF
jgi:hypothetical protein